MDFDRLKQSFFALVDQRLARADYFASYRCRVAAQNDDGTLELRPESPRFGAGLSRVPVRGLPGIEVKVKAGADVLLAWDGGDPGRPFASLFTPDSLEEIKVTASVKLRLKAPDIEIAQADGTARAVAVVGSGVSGFFVGVPPGAPGQVTGYITDGVNSVKAG